MAVECTANNLAELAACFGGLTPPQANAVKIYLLAVVAGVDPDPEAIVEASKCLMGMSPMQAAAAQTYLLCQIANG
jgi:hypothetical protein